jgi:hypothetical protein
VINNYYGHQKVEVSSVIYDTVGVHVTFSGLQQFGANTSGGPIISWSPVYTYSNYEFSIYETPGSAFARLNREPWWQPDSILVFYAADLMQFLFADVCNQYLTEYSKSLYYNTVLRTELSRADTALILNVGQSTLLQAGCYPSGPGDTVTSMMLDECAYRVRSGLGLEYVSHQGIDDNGFAELVGYITSSGDSVGNVWRTWFLTDVENAAELSVQLMPNPSATLTSIEWPSAEAWNLELLDAKGMEIRREEGAGKTHRLDVSELPAGIYLLRLSQGGKAVGRKLVVSH